MDVMLLVKATLLLSSALVAARLLRRSSAASRHALWTVAFAAVLALPVLALVMPALRVPLPGVRRVPSYSGQPGFNEFTTVASGFSRTPGPPEGGPHVSREVRAVPDTATTHSAALPPASTLLATAWIVGVVGVAGTLLLALERARKLAASSDEIRDPEWRDAVDDIGSRLGLRRRARLLMNRDVTTPMAGGLWRPVVFLPSSARTWTAEQRDVVLAHEIAHLAGRDALRHVAARIAVALYWFHPLVWIAARLATVAREQACDEAVLTLGTRPSLYARVLLELSESMSPPSKRLAVLPMVEPSLLETRLVAILDDDARPVRRRRVLVPAIGAAVFTLGVAAVQPAAPASTPATERPAASAPVQLSAPTPTPLTERRRPADASRRLVAGLAARSAAMQVDADRQSACWWAPFDGPAFNGSISRTTFGSGTVVYQQIGTRGADRVIQRTFGDLRVCMLAEDVGDRGVTDRPSQWPGRAGRVVMETQRGSGVQRLEVGRQGGGAQTSWRVNGTIRPFDASAERWRDRLVATLDAIWDLSMLRGEVSSLRGQISSIRGQQSSIRGEISSLRGHVSSLRGRISSVRGEESSLRGQLSSIGGHVSSLRGAISSERGAISSLNGTRHRATDEEIRQINARIDRHESEIARIEHDLREYNADARVADVEREIRSLDTEGKVAAIEAEIRAFDLDGKVTAAERRLEALDVDGKIAAIERQIANLDADRRGRQLEDRRDAALKELEAAIAAIR